MYTRRSPVENSLLFLTCEGFLKRQISFMSCVAVLASIFGVLGLNPAAQTAPTKPLTIETMYQPGGLTGRAPETLEWSPDGTRLTFVQRDEKGEKGELWYVDTATGEKKVLVSAVKLASLDPDLNKVVKNEREKERRTRYHVAAYLWAPDSKHLIFDSQGQLWLYDLGSETAVQFTSASDPSGDPKFSPDGGHVAYVRKHNLCVRPVNGKDEKQLTKDTGDNLFNGDIDWVYAEELGVRSNYFWSPDSKDIVFLHMDETKVPTYPITDWIPTHPSVENEKYPKVGDPNPEVKLGIVEADKGKVRWLSLTNDPETYIPRFGWVRDGVIWAEVLNRTEDKMDLYFVDAKSGKSRIVLTETTPGAWIDFEHLEVRFLKSNGQFLWPSWRDGNMHLYLYSFDKQNPMGAAAKLERQLTKGDFEVMGIEGVDETAGTVFFSANKDDPRQLHIFSAQLDGSGSKALTTEEGMHSGKFQRRREALYAYLFWAAGGQPRFRSARWAGPATRCGRREMRLAEYGLRAPKYLEFKADDGTTLYGRLLLPPDTPASGKIPLIVNIYGGPAAQMVRKGAPDPFDEILSRKGFADFCGG